MVQVFVHSVLQMPVMDKVLSGFIDTFYESISDDKKWSEVKGRKVLNSMKDFLDNLGVVLYEALLDDCSDIMRKYSVNILKDTHNGSVNVLKDTHNGRCSNDTEMSSSDKTEYECGDNKTGDEKPADQEDKDFDDDLMNMDTDIDTKRISEGDNGHKHDNLHKSSHMNSIDVNSHDHNPSKTGDLLDIDVGIAASSSEKGARTLEDEAKKEAQTPEDEAEKGARTLENEAAKESRNLEEDLQGALKGMTSGDKEKQRLHFLEQCDDDEMRTHIRSALRRQIEIEVFVPCSARLRVVLGRSFSMPEISLRRNILKIKDQPQSFYGIPVHQISPSSWDEAVFLMRDIRSKTLPHDRLEALLATAKEIPRQFIREHPHSPGNKCTLGADDFLPIFIYILARAQIPDLLALTEELQGICDPDKRMSETGYYLATLEASLQHIIEAEVRTDQKYLFPMLEKENNDSDTESDRSNEEDAWVKKASVKN
eukprot:CAMPEP_0119039550 /NCGR_PEP_ID=MMETSP1177-20130426/9103_1 /TAXON_ID=2985 /ORGANISM="Ochromonas sp, Strain CCMP1899" /LENGTH=481 /DNA_ID=CAMNT_0007003577 /DNA_START=1602 /DNA_END=3047 /DNA_ORIENTATION=+